MAGLEQGLGGGGVAEHTHQLTPAAIEAEFAWFSIWFAVNHGTVTTPLVMATSILDTTTGNTGNGILYVVSCLSSLFLATPLVGGLGPRGGALAGMSLYCAYCASFALTAFFGVEGLDVLSALCWYAGSACGGVAAGVMWTAQGAYFSGTATLMASRTGGDRQAVTAGLAGSFAFVYLAAEVATKVCFSALQSLGLSGRLVGAVFTAVAALATAMMTRALPVASDGGGALAQEALSPRGRPLGRQRLQRRELTVGPADKVLAAARMWGDPVIWLLSPTNLAFGFCAAFMNGYVNATFVKEELGERWVALMSGVSALVAAILARAFGRLGGIVGKGPVLMTGALCFICIPLSLGLLVPCLGEDRCRSHWGLGLAALFVLQGAGRAVYESTNRAIFSDFFVGPQSDGAFANCMLQSSLSFAASFFLQASLKAVSVAFIVVVLATLAFATYPLARHMRTRQKLKEESLVAGLAVERVDPMEQQQQQQSGA